MSKRGAYKRPAPKETLTERVTKLEGRLNGLAQAVAELESRMSKVEVVVTGPKDLEPIPPFR